MKVKDKFEEYKKLNPDTLVVMKVGSFYVAFGMDAFILSYVFSYQVKNDKVGFPLSTLDKVLFELGEKKINYMVVVEDIVTVEKKNLDNQYFEVLTLAQKFYNNKTLTDFLIERIRLLVHKDESNYFKIKDFIDEL